MFVDDFWLAFTLASHHFGVPPRLVLLNTEQTVGAPRLAQTTFWLNTDEDWLVGTPYLDLGQGGHEPTPEEDSLAPFYQDPSERILVVEFFEGGSVFVMKAEVLLELARERGDTELGWEQWRVHAVEVVSCYRDFLWVSGSRLFCARWEHENSWVDVYDFSPRASAQHMLEVAHKDAGIMWQMRPNVECDGLPLHDNRVHFTKTGHDSMVFFGVNALAPKPGQNLTEVLYDRTLMMIWYTCGPFNGRCAVGVILCQLMNFVSQHAPVHR